MANPTYSLASIKTAAGIAEQVEVLDTLLAQLNLARAVGDAQLTANLTLLGATGLPLPAAGMDVFLAQTIADNKQLLLNALETKIQAQRQALLNNLSTTLPAMCEATPPSGSGSGGQVS